MRISDWSSDVCSSDLGIVVHSLGVPMIVAFFVAALALGVLMTLPIGGADMTVVNSLYTALTGLAVAFEGRSGARRVGKECVRHCRSRWSRCNATKNNTI